ncbi:MAG: tryptophan--tRNA ligase [Bacteroidales bacterium]|nr:tryptophan--tRNA ligase [Bacteroidales bacterium]
METVVSGIRPTGNLHLGNYFGAMKNFVKMQYKHKCYFFIADFHSLTTHPTPENLMENIKQVLAEYLACGLDPEAATIYLQSDIHEIPELYLLLNMISYLGELERCTSFKEKVRVQPDNVNAGLLTYPVLMATDIIIHKATKVPVGKDQEQHLEMTRNFASRFNRMYNVNYFPEPVAYNFGEELIKIPGLDGSGKMGKSEGPNNAIFLVDEPEVIRKKVMKAVTDAGPTEINQKKPEVIENLFLLMNAVSASETIKHFDDLYNDCTLKYGNLKKQLAEDIIKFTNPFREKIKELKANNAYLKKVAEEGAEKARKSAAKTLKEVREIVGFKEF